MNRTKTSKRLLVLLLAIIAVFSPALLNTYAMSNSLEEGTEPADAIRGPIRIVAVFEEGYKDTIKVDVGATFEDGIYHYYTLSPETPEAIDNIMVGDYRAVAYSANEEKNYTDSDFRIYTYNGTVTVKENAEDIPSIVVVEGSRSFIEKYGIMLTEHRDKNGDALVGTYSEDDAKGFLQEEIARQDQPEEVQKGIGIEDSEQIEIPDIGDEEQTKSPHSIVKPLATIMSVLLLAGLVAIAWKKRRE